MNGFVDLHCHYVPGVDDGVRTHDEGVELCRALKAIGFDTVVATPHIRAGMFDNARPDLEQRFAGFVERAAEEPAMPELLLGAEHFCDEHFVELFETGRALPYAGGRALLLELPPSHIPPWLADRCFRMQVRGVRPVLAHPERYAPLFGTSAPIARLVEMGVPALLDVMSLAGKYGRKPRHAAERMLEDGVYYAACSDCHRPADVDTVAAGMQRLSELVGPADARRLLADGPRAILRGEVEA